MLSSQELNKIELIFNKYKIIYNARRYRKKFIPLELIAIDPKKYGYNIEPRESKARQNDFINDNSKVVACILANRAGKSNGAAIKFLNNCEESKISGLAWVLTESYELQTTSTQAYILEYLKPEKIISREYATSTALRQIKFINKHNKIITIGFKTYEQGWTKLQSAKLIAAWIDEEPKEEQVYNEIRTRCMDYKAQIIISFTPLKGMTWAYTRIYRSTSKHIKVYVWSMYDNPFISLEEIEAMKEDFSPKQVKMRIYGQFCGSESMCYYPFDRTIHCKQLALDLTENIEVVIDWGVNVTAIGFWKQINDKFYLVDAKELKSCGYQQVMNYCLSRGYGITNWYCDPAGRQRNQATKTGTSLLQEIKRDYGITFNYIKSLGVEESIELFNSYLMNGKNDVRILINENIILCTEKDIEIKVADRLENYVRDEKTGQPIKDGINDHFADICRYYIANKVRRQDKWRQG